MTGQHFSHRFPLPPSTVPDGELTAAKLRLSDAFLSDRGFQYMTDVSNEVFGNPFWLIDINWSFLTSPSATFIADDPYLKSEVAQGYAADTTLEDLRRRGVYDEIQRTGEPAVYSAFFDPERKLIAAPIRVKSVTVGYLQLANIRMPFRPWDEQLMKYAAKLFAAEFQKRQHIEINQGNLFSSLLKSLLDGDLKDPASIYGRMASLGIRPGRQFQLLCAPIDEHKLAQASLNTLAGQLHSLLPTAIYVVYPTQILFLINLYGSEPLDRDTLDSVKSYLSGCGLTAGLSPLFPDILLAPDYARLAARATQLGPVLHPAETLYHYSDYAIYHLVHEARKIAPRAATPAGAALELLAKYDRAHNTALTETLYCWLDCLQNIAQAADRLGIHGNTLRNRVEKIKELTRCPFDRGGQVLEFLLSYKAMEYEEKLSRL